MPELRMATTEQPGSSRWALLAGGAVLVCSLTALTVTGQLSDGTDGPALKAYHLVLAGLGLVLLAVGKLVRWRAEMGLYFGALAGSSLLAYLSFDPRPVFANVVVALYAATIGATLGTAAGKAGALRACRVAAIALLLAILAKGVLHRDALIAFMLAPNGHPTLPSLYGGGVNIEATFTALAGAFFLGSLLLWPYLAVSLVLSVLYASRAGTLTVVGVAVLAIWRAICLAPPGSAQRRRLLLAVGISCVLLVTVAGGVLGFAADTPAAAYILDRFGSVGEDPGSMGRLALWTSGIEVFVAHPMGVGFGNAVPQIARTVGRYLHEDNLHNQYLQHFVEGGVVGGVAFLALVGVTWRRLWRSGGTDPFLAYLGLYFVLAALQFRGAEALLWLVFGLQHGASLAGRAPVTRTSVVRP